MIAVLILLAFMGLIYWFLGGRPRLTGGFGGQRVYLRRGPGLGGIAVAVIALVYLADHVAEVGVVLLIVALIAGLGFLGFVTARRAMRR